MDMHLIFEDLNIMIIIITIIIMIIVMMIIITIRIIISGSIRKLINETLFIF